MRATRRIEWILRRRRSHLAKELEGISDIRSLSRETRELIVDELGDEFSARGLRPDGEPNEYGLVLEELTDACGLAWDEEPN